jgi:hypothetical protein
MGVAVLGDHARMWRSVGRSVMSQTLTIGQQTPPASQTNCGPGGPRADSKLVERWTPSSDVGWRAYHKSRFPQRPRHAGDQVQAHEHRGRGRGPVGLVAAVGDGRVLRHDLPVLEAIDLPPSRPATGTTKAVRGVRLHDLQHTFAVLELSAGVHFMQVSKWLGHSTFTLSLDVYCDYIPRRTAEHLTPCRSRPHRRPNPPQTSCRCDAPKLRPARTTSRRCRVASRGRRDLCLCAFFATASRCLENESTRGTARRALRRRTPTAVLRR